MIFNSLDFLVFFFVVILVFYSIPQRFRWMFLLAGSYYFYMCWKVEYIFLIVLSTLVDYWAGLKMSDEPVKKKRKKYLAASLLVNLGLLFFFKYYGFFTTNTELLFSKMNIFVNFREFDLLLPVGISFYTFQTLSYSIDVYRGELKAERHLGYFALYVTYFPQLVAGPIERAGALLPQLRQEPKITREDIRYGINKILLGFFKKLVVADTVATYVDQVFDNVAGSTGMQFYLAINLFAIQIFCDFSGYSDIAIGTARLMGVKLIENFNRPLWVHSFKEYWSRWHISLSRWIRDYMYTPLLKMVPSLRRNHLYVGLCTIIVFTAIGFWHGAKWTFVLFGFYHGFIMVIQRVLNFMPFFQRLCTKTWYRIFTGVVNAQLALFSIAFFRAQDIQDVVTIFNRIATDFRLTIGEVLLAYRFELLVSVFVSHLLIYTVFFNKDLKFRHNWLYISSVLFLIMFFGQDYRENFIYFQF
jgi:D-alanyl-lipoteichoic acid acyltransferase DltB (MBOAT superfamily)